MKKRKGMLTTTVLQVSTTKGVHKYWILYKWRNLSDGLTQDYSNSVVNALESLQSCAKPPIDIFVYTNASNMHKSIITSLLKYHQKLKV